MKLYIDGSNGVSSDMILNGLLALGGEKVEEIPIYKGHKTYIGIREYIETLKISEKIKSTSKEIYLAIAEAEAEVHNETLKTVHFHEVGRQEAIENIINISSCIESLKVREIYCTQIHDGYGEINCSHGTIPVPVPAVRAMMKNCSLDFSTDNIDTEMVTPSGLGVLIGLNAKKAISFPKGDFVLAKGTRDIGREGLKMRLL